MKSYDYIIVFVIIYMVISTIEYLIHCYTMHNLLPIPLQYFSDLYNQHIEHHIISGKDPHFVLKKGDADLCIPFKNTIYVFTIVFFICYSLFLFYPRKIYSSYISFCIIIILSFVVLMWNTYHPFIHGLDGKDYCGWYSIPANQINPNSLYSQYIINNHIAHHYFKNEENGNYNVTLPFADFLFGTYNVIPSHTYAQPVSQRNAHS